jgi:hypothetical protein
MVLALAIAHTQVKIALLSSVIVVVMESVILKLKNVIAYLIISVRNVKIQYVNQIAQVMVSAIKDLVYVKMDGLVILVI